MQVIIDTNVIMNENFNIEDYEKVFIPIIVVEELDNLKLSSDENKAYKARTAIRKLDNANNVEFLLSSSFVLPIYLTQTKMDNKILSFVKDITDINKDIIFLVDDKNLSIKAKALNISCKKFEENIDSIYTGWKIIKMNKIELANWYESEVKANWWDLNINEYLLLHSIEEDKLVDVWCWTKKGFRHISNKKIESSYFGKFKYKDIYQQCAIDSFSNNQMTVIKGKPGSGKSYLTSVYAMSMIENNKYDKIIVFANPVAALNSAKLGFYPGSKDEKLLDSQIGNMLSSKFGDRCQLESLIRNNKLILLPFSDLRGFDTTGMKAIIWITEAQNLDIALMKLAIQRIGDDCQLIIDGDYEAQVDCQSFSGRNNGMRKVVEVFRNEEFYGEVELPIIYRSKLAAIADRM